MENGAFPRPEVTKFFATLDISPRVSQPGLAEMAQSMADGNMSARIKAALAFGPSSPVALVRNRLGIQSAVDEARFGVVVINASASISSYLEHRLEPDEKKAALVNFKTELANWQKLTDTFGLGGTVQAWTGKAADGTSTMFLQRATAFDVLEAVEGRSPNSGALALLRHEYAHTQLDISASPTIGHIFNEVRMDQLAGASNYSRSTGFLTAVGMLTNFNMMQELDKVVDGESAVKFYERLKGRLGADAMMAISTTPIRDFTWHSERPEQLLALILEDQIQWRGKRLVTAGIQSASNERIRSSTAAATTASLSKHLGVNVPPLMDDIFKSIQTAREAGPLF